MKKILAVLFALQALSCTFALAETDAAPFRQAGNYVTFGRYEQDNDTADGAEGIEWLVLETDGDKAMLLSRCALDCVPYNANRAPVLWETCTLRTWLNDTFLNAAFTEEEQGAILTTEVDNSAAENLVRPRKKYNANDTRDKVYLLSYAEVNRYFGSDEERKCAVTDYALAKGAYTKGSHGGLDGKKCALWWLRSPGSFDLEEVGLRAMRVHANGHVYLNGSDVNAEAACIRPVIRVDLTAEMFK